MTAFRSLCEAGMKALPASLSLAVAGALLSSSPASAGALLGEVLSLSPLGEPLRVEIASRGADVAAGSCLRIPPTAPAADGLPTVTGARVATTGRGSEGRVVVTHPAPVLEPALRLTLEDVCDTRLRREYLLLLPYPDVARSFPALAVAEPLRAARPAPRTPARPPRSQEGAGVATPAASPRRSEPPASAPSDDRLRLEAEGPAVAPEAVGPGRVHTFATPEAHALREAQLVAALDRSIAAQLELMERIRRLEEVHAALKSRIEVSPAPLAATMPARPIHRAGAQPAPPVTGTSVPGWLYTAGLLTLAVSFLAARGLRGRRRPPPPAAHPDAPDWVEEALATEPIHGAGVVPAAPPVVPRRSNGESPAPPPSLPHIELEEEIIAEHDSAIELAEIMMSFGRVHGAAETLAEFIRANPKQAVTPWLKLLEVYRAAGLRAEFDALARQLNQTFNVKVVTWDTFDTARRAPQRLEEMPHVIERLQQVWGTREGQTYLQGLLRDNREGTRHGFSLPVVEEILMLAGVLEERLGPCGPGAPARHPDMGERRAA